MKNCWIIGASDGIGRSLAKKLYVEGYNLAISARDEGKLNQLKLELISVNPSKQKILVLPLDVVDADSLKKSAEEIVKNFEEIDLAVFSPAIYKPTSVIDFDLDFAHQTMAINFGGCLNFLHAILPQMIKQKSGQVALVASVAGYRGLPKSFVYGASKAAMINLAEGIYSELKSLGIDLSVINPGFVDTRLTKQNKFKMPFIISQEKAAEEIFKGLKQKKFEIHFPKKFTLFLKFLRITPYKLFFSLTKKLR